MANSSWSVDKNNNSDEFLKVRPDCKLKVRLIEDPVKVIRVFSNDRKCAILNNEEIGKRLTEQYPHIISNVSVRFSCWCIDREDGLMKILEMPISVAKAIGNRESLIGKKVGGEYEGCDWSITTNGKQGMEVRYEVVCLEETSLTQTEKGMLKLQKSEKYGYFNLTKIYESHNFKEAKEKLIG
jgi:hypothetical protein